MVSPANPTHFCMEAPERCSTTIYAWWVAAAFTHEVAGLADDVGDEAPQAAMTRASVALAKMRRLRTWFPPGGQPSRTRRTKPTAKKLPCRFARTGRRCGRSGLLAYGSPPSGPPSRGLHLSGVCWTRAPRSPLRDSSGFSPDSLGTQWNLRAATELSDRREGS